MGQRFGLRGSVTFHTTTSGSDSIFSHLQLLTSRWMSGVMIGLRVEGQKKGRIEGKEGRRVVGRLRVIYSKLQVYTHTQNCTENKYVHAQGFYFLTTTNNFPKICFSSLSFSFPNTRRNVAQLPPLPLLLPHLSVV